MRRYCRFNLKRRGYMLAEILVSLWLITVLAALAGKALFDYYHARDHYLWRQAAILAADAQLQRYQAGAELDSQPSEGVMADNILLRTAVEPGRDQWQGFKRVTVTASVLVQNEEKVREQISGYVSAEVRP
ncbi:MAG: type II secretion system protein [Planctomycetota bacterium]|nr:MAG: type II secretion system protein [Planctomycetota bacterium]